MNKKSKDFIWNTAIYIRLSKEDGNDVSYSVRNQQEMILSYIDKKGNNDIHEVVGIYIDDGLTGTDDNREEFQKMIRDIENKKVNCVIVKDLSRPFRNYADQGHYLEYVFPYYDVRFISLQLPFLDSYLYPEAIENIAVAIQGVVNDNHCRETSIKVRQVFNYKRSKGKFIGAFAPYGYKKNPEDKNSFIIDDEAGDVVRSIYDYFVLKGMSKVAIAKKLTKDGVLNPTAYKRREGMKYRNPFDKYGGDFWNTATITKILKNQSYLGDMVQGKQKVKSYKIHNRVGVPKEDWFVVKDTHAPIISKELFNKAQKLQSLKTKIRSKKSESYIFSGLLRCQDCKKAMCRKKSGKYVYYICRSYKELGEDVCSRHTIKEKELEDAVLAAIKLQFELVKNIDEILKKGNDTLLVEGDLKYRRSCEMKKKQVYDLERTAYFRDSLYESWKNGAISEEEYRRMKKNYEDKWEELKNRVEELKKIQQAEKENINRGDWSKLAKIEVLDRSIVLNLINVIFIHESNGITVEFKFLDKYKEVIA